MQVIRFKIPSYVIRTSVVTLTALTLGVSTEHPVLAATATQLSPAINQASGSIPATFYDQTQQVSYSGGSVCLSSVSDRCAAPAIDDAVRISVNGSQVFYQESFTHDFGPVDFSGYLPLGTSSVRTQLIDLIAPVRGGSALWLVFGGGSVPSTPVLQLRAISVTKSRVEFDDQYFVTVTLFNPATATQGGELTLHESGALTTLGDSAFSSGLSVSVPPGERQYSFGPIQHKYHWIDPSDCWKLQTAITEGLKDWVLGRASMLVAVLEALADHHLARTENVYTYHASLATNNQTVGGGSATVAVAVPQHKLSQFESSLFTDLWWPGWSVTGIKAQLKGPQFTQIAATFLTNEVFAWQASCSLKENALDPDPDYKTIAQAVPVVVPSEVQNLPEGPEKAASIDLLRFVTNLIPLNKSLARYEGAKAAGSNEWMAAQLEAARRFAGGTLYDLYLLEALQSPIADQNPISPADAEAARNYVLSNGLPAFEKQLLASVGAPSHEINNLPHAFLALADVSVQAWLTASHPAKSTIPVYQGLLGYANQRLSELTPGADTTQPAASINVSGGTKGLVGWYGKAPTFAVGGSDAGGCGIKSTEFSADFGRSWKPAGAPITLSDGINRMIARVTDNCGNIQFPPARADVKVDTVRPRTGVKLSYSVVTTSTGRTVRILVEFPCDDSNGALETSGCSESYYSFGSSTGPFTKYTGPFVKEEIKLNACSPYQKSFSYSPYLYSIDVAGNKASPARVTASVSVSLSGGTNCGSSPTPTPAPGCAITSNVSSLTLSGGSSFTVTVKVKSVGGLNSPVTLSVSGLPTGISGSLSPASVTPTTLGASSSLKLTASQPPQGQSSTVTVSGISSSGVTCTPAKFTVKT